MPRRCWGTSTRSPPTACGCWRSPRSPRRPRPSRPNWTVQGTFLGLQAMHDPPRAQAVRAVAACRAAGVQVKMITGDHADTVRAIAAAVGVVDSAAGATVLTGAELARLGGR